MPALPPCRPRKPKQARDIPSTSITVDLPEGRAALEADLDLLSDAATADDFNRLVQYLDGLDQAEAEEVAAAYSAEQERTMNMSFARAAD